MLVNNRETLIGYLYKSKQNNLCLHDDKYRIYQQKKKIVQSIWLFLWVLKKTYIRILLIITLNNRKKINIKKIIRFHLYLVQPTISHILLKFSF